MLQGYIDDSGSNLQQSHFVLAGYVMEADLWASFSKAWDKVLQKYPPIKYFKMSEAEAGEGQFLNVPSEFRQLKVKQLFEVIEKHQPTGVSCSVPMSEYNRVAKPKEINSPYYFLFSTKSFKTKEKRVAEPVSRILSAPLERGAGRSFL